MASVKYPYRYAWKNTPERERLFDKRCRIVNEDTKAHFVKVQFEDGEEKVVSHRALRRVQ